MPGIPLKERKQLKQQFAVQEDSLYQPPVAYFTEISYPEIKVVLYSRVSGREQNRQGNLLSQETLLKKEITVFKPRIIASFREISSGWLSIKERPELQKAIQICKEKKAILLAESPDRFLRSKDFNSVINWSAIPSKQEWLEFPQKMLSTILNPMMLPEEVRSYQIKRGQKSDKKEVFSKKVRQRRKWFDVVCRMHLEGFSSRRIEELTGVSRMTLKYWIKQFLKLRKNSCFLFSKEAENSMFI